MQVPRPNDSELSDYHRELIRLVPECDITSVLQEQIQSGSDFIQSLPTDQMNVVHEGYGWSVRQVIEHCLDAERVFGYRLLRFASGDQVNLPGWDENHYAACGYCEPANSDQLAAEWRTLRAANVCLLNRLSASAIGNSGIADNNPFSIRGLLFVMAAHWIHHVEILRKRLN